MVIIPSTSRRRTSIYGFLAFRGRSTRFAVLQAGALLVLSIAANACGRQAEREAVEPEVVEMMTAFGAPGDSLTYLKDDIWFYLRSLLREHLERAQERLARRQHRGAPMDPRASAALLRLDATRSRAEEQDALRKSASALEVLADPIEARESVPRDEVAGTIRHAHYQLGRFEVAQGREAWDRSEDLVARGYLFEAIEQARAGFAAGDQATPTATQILLDEARGALERTGATEVRRATDYALSALSELREVATTSASEVATTPSSHVTRDRRTEQGARGAGAPENGRV